VSTDRHLIDVGGIPVEVVRKEIKNLHVGVYPPAGRVRVAAPQRLDDEAVRLAVVSRLGWIRRRQKEFAGQDRQSQREMVTGESHYFQGRRYLLDVKECECAPGLRLVGHTTIELRVPPAYDRDQRDAVLQRWYRRQLRAMLPPLTAKWEPRVGKTVAEVRIKRMKTRWGSCNAEARRIWLNLELAKKPDTCVEYVLVHEMVHLHERHHTERFQELMERLMPTWRHNRDELNRAPLAHEDWAY
jgi:predicted metal-dependent hydrolase